MNCHICKKELKNQKALAKHINTDHTDITKEEYFIKYLSINNEHICSVCGNPNTFIGITRRFSKNCSSKCAKQNPEYLTKLHSTNISKYGSTTPLKSKDVLDKIKKTNLEKYGCENVFQNKEIKEKLKETIITKYGVDNVSKSNDIKEKKKETTLSNYGVEHPMFSEEVKEKQKKTISIIEYNKLINTNRLNGEVTPLFTENEYTNTYAKYPFNCNVCKNDFLGSLLMGKIPRCPTCYPIESRTSLLEQEVADFIKSLNINIITNDRTLIAPLEVDIICPDHKLAIEFDGLYWHSELNGKDKNYHINKTNICNQLGYQLLHIFENEWINKKEIVKSIIVNKLKLNINKIYARKCTIKLIDKSTKKEFLNNTHIQGNVPSFLDIGLYYKDELISILVMGKSRFNKRYTYEILRFSSKLNTTVVGGFSKLMSYFKSNYPGSIITYADLRYGNGNVYINNGFKFIDSTKPNYFYTNDYKDIYSRQKFQKHKLKDQLKLFDSTLTEWQNMVNNNFDRIWDCGNNVFGYTSEKEAN